MSFNDIFSSDFLSNITTFNFTDTIIALILSFLLGLFVYYVHKRTYTGVMYSSGFGVSLIGLCMVTTFVILAVTSNVVLSLGMVGALSIVRFRTAVKEPLDLVFLFWSIAAGIVLGAGMIPLAVFGSVLLGLVLVIFVGRKAADTPYMLVVNCDGSESEQAATELIGASVKRFVPKSKTVRASGIELTLEIRLLGDTTAFVNRLCELSGVKSAALVSYNGDYLS